VLKIHDVFSSKNVFPHRPIFGYIFYNRIASGDKPKKAVPQQFTLSLQLHLKENQVAGVSRWFWCLVGVGELNEWLTLSLDANHPQLGKTTPRRTFAEESV